MIRDRLPELKKHISSKSGEQSESDGIDECAGWSHGTDMDNLLQMYKKIMHNLEIISTNINSMKTMAQAKNSKEFNGFLENDFNQLRTHILQIGKNLITTFKTIADNLPSENDYSTLGRMQRWLYYGFFEHYVILWTKSDQFFHEYELKLKKNLQMQARILNCDLTEEDIDTLITHKFNNLYIGNILDTEKASKILEALKGRLCELEKLEKSIEEVHLLFIRLQTLIVDQGCIIQRIENHFKNARDYTEIAAEELKQAEELKNSSRTTTFILVAAAVVIVSLFSWNKNKNK